MHIGETDHMQYNEVHKTNIQGSEVIIHFIRLFSNFKFSFHK